ncbi:hypothetical protein C7M84_004650 [Penaeus vannamei]|uniref:RNA-directed DNA polymerase n=1 Tax=Penaeus vannamei TaxID=6689 RepID=A0A3R7M9M1_PENVA|nr:hypothetical protein C7M84_004650 [Penaeus vannamei]
MRVVTGALVRHYLRLPQVKCYICQKGGHKAWDCYFRPNINKSKVASTSATSGPTRKEAAAVTSQGAPSIAEHPQDDASEVVQVDPVGVIDDHGWIKCRSAVLDLAHSSIMGGHLATGKTKDRVMEKFFWPGITKDIERYCRSCDVCQRTVDKAVDIVGPIEPRSSDGSRYILTVVDFRHKIPGSCGTAEHRHCIRGGSSAVVVVNDEDNAEGRATTIPSYNQRETWRDVSLDSDLPADQRDDAKSILQAFGDVLTDVPGLFQFTVLPFGLVNAPAVFNRLMRHLFGNIDGVETFLDDILIHSKTWKQHCSILQKVLGILRETNLTARPVKCEIAPTTKKEVRSFMGLSGYYRRFVPDYATIAAPLNDLVKKNAPNRVKTDASDVGLGAVLLQEDADVKMPVAYASRKLSDAEKKYSVVERECLAVVWATKKFYRYLYGQQFYLETDHRPITYLDSAKTLNGRLMRWAIALQEFRMIFSYIKGTEVTSEKWRIPRPLSRYPSRWCHESRVPPKRFALQPLAVSAATAWGDSRE